MMKYYASVAILFTSLFLNTAVAAIAAPTITVPLSSTTGNFDISWSYCASSCQYRRSLEGTTDYIYGPTCFFCTHANETNIPVGRWRYEVTTCDTAGEFQGPQCSGWSDSRIINVTRETAPTAATNFVTDAKDWGEVNLSWVKGSGTVNFYRLSRNGQTIAANLATNTTSYVDANVAAGAYTYQLQSCNDSGCSSTQQSTNVRTDGVSPPGFLSLNPVSSTTNLDNTGRVTLNWQRAKGNVQGYAIFASYRPNSSVNYPPLAEVRRVGSETFTLSFVDRVQGEYFYGVKAIRPDGGLGLYSNGNFFYTNYSERPSEPRSLTTIIPTSNGQIINRDFSLRWTAPSGNFERYQLYERQTSPVSGTKKLLYEGTETEFAVPRPNNGNYQYSIVAVGRLGEVSAARLLNLVIVTTPKVPTNVTVPGYAQSTNIIVNWDFDGVADEFEIYQQSPVGHNYFAAKTIQKQFTVPNQRPGIWSYGVRACITSVTPKLCSDYGRSQSISIQDPQRFKAPQGFTATPANNNGDYIISWQPVVGANHYIVSESTGTYFSGSTNVHEGSNTSIIMLNKPTADYFYALRSCFKSATEFRCGHFRFLGTPDGAVHVVNNRDQNSTEIPNAQVISLGRPEHDPTVGQLDSESSVAGGKANHSVPITLPPGRRGMQPKISLNYSSSSTMNIAGVGFGLNGLSKIGRCGRTAARDGINASVDLSVNDRFCLDGQVLVLVKGTYGAANSEYRTESDTFRKIELLNADAITTSSFFRITQKDGTKVEYGADGAITGLNAIHSLPGSSVPMSWAVRLYEDTFGNNIVFQYTPDQSAGEFLIDTIFYTGKNNAKGDRGVRFVYEDRYQFSSSYFRGYEQRNTKRLRQISTFAPTKADIRNYFLTYRPSRLNGLSLVESIQECAGTICRPATTFEWEDSELDFDFRRLNFDGGFSVRNADAFELGNDIDGDGKPEIVLLRGARGAFDIYRGFYSSELGLEPDSIRVVNLDEEGNEIPVSDELAALVAKYPDIALSSARRTFLGKPTSNLDFNKDGRTDLISRVGGTYKIIYFEGNSPVEFDTGIATQPFGPTVSQVSVISTPEGQPFRRTPVQSLVRPFFWELFEAGDYNLDGRTDFVVTEPGSAVNTGKLVVYLNCSTETTPGQWNMRFCKQPMYNVIGGVPSNHNDIAVVDTNGEFRLGFFEPVGEKITGAGDLDGNGLNDFFIEWGEIPKLQVSGSLESSNPRTISHVLLTHLNAQGQVYVERKLISALNLPQPEVTRFGPQPLLMGDINGDGLRDVINQNSYQLATGNPNQPFTAVQSFNGIFGLLYDRERCKDGISCQIERGNNGTTSAFYMVDVDNDGIDELFYPKNILTNYCRGTFLLAPGEPEAQCAAADSEVRHVYEWEMIDFHETKAGGIEVSYHNFDGQLISSPITDAFNDINGDGKPELYAQMGYLERHFLEQIPEDLRNAYGDTYQFPVDQGAGPNHTGAFFSINLAGDNRITRVTSGLGNESRFHYQSLNEIQDLHGCGISDNKPFYETTKEAVSGAYFHFNSTMNVVAKFEQSNGIGGFTTNCYRYKDNMFNHEGRGIQGFERIIIEEANTIQSENNKRTVMDFYQRYPLTGRLKTQRVELVNDDMTAIDVGSQNPLSKQTYRYNLAENTNVELARVFTVEEKTSTYSYTKNNPGVYRNLLSETQILTSYGDNSTNDTHIIYGRPSQIETINREYKQGSVIRTYRSVSEMEYQPVSESIWAVDLISRKVDTTYPVIYQDNINVAIAEGTNKIRTSETIMDIAPDTRFVHSSIIHPGKPEEMIMTNTADTWGNTKEVTRSGISLHNNAGQNISRTERYDFAPYNGYFAHTVRKDLGAKATMGYRLEDGKQDSITDANSLVTRTTFDAFGTSISIKGPSVPIRYIGTQWCTATEACSHKVETRQDGEANLVSELDQEGRIIRTRVIGFNNTYSGSGRNDTITETRYDHLGREIEIVGAHFENDTYRPVTTMTDFDALGRAGTKIIDAEPQYRKTTYQYTGFDTLITVDTQGGNYLTESTDHPLQTMSRTYDSLKQLVSTTDQMGNKSFYRYDGEGNVIATQINDAIAGKQLVSTMTYNALGQRLSITTPNSGTKYTHYNGMNELLSQTDANGNTISFDYDQLGRVVRRGLNGNTEIEYTYDQQLIGYKDSERHILEGVTNSTIYDALGRMVSEKQMIEAQNLAFEIHTQYDTYYGKIKGMTYPAGDQVAYLYDEYGYKLVDYNPVNGTIYQTIQEVDPRSNIIARQYGNSVQSIRDYHTSGQALNICATLTGNCDDRAVSMIDYGYDAWGDIRRIFNQTADYEDRYRFDALHRLTRSEHTAYAVDGVNQTINYAFDGLGNLLTKDDYATDYQYGGSSNGQTYGPNQVRRITKVDGSIAEFTYDNNGNMLIGDNRTVAYNSINKPVMITQGNDQTRFFYGSDNLRYKQESVVEGKQKTTYYMGKLFEWVETRDVETNQLENITSQTYAEGYLLFSRNLGQSNADGAFDLYYLHKDMIGSIDSITDIEGNVIERRSHDPFGKPRDHIGNARNELGSDITNRGYSEHEHLDGVELIHMNGRAYDFNLGRFLSVDPFVVNPTDTQSYNSYSYVLNNPLSNTDPTGYQTCEGEGAGECGGSSNPEEDSVPEAGEQVEIDNGDGTTTTITGTAGSVVVVTTSNQSSNSSGLALGRFDSGSRNSAAGDYGEFYASALGITGPNPVGSYNENIKVIGDMSGVDPGSLTLLSNYLGLAKTIIRKYGSDKQVKEIDKVIAFVDNGFFEENSQFQTTKAVASTSLEGQFPAYENAPSGVGFIVFNDSLVEWANGSGSFNYEGLTIVRGTDQGLLDIVIHELGHTITSNMYDYNDVTKRYRAINPRTSGDRIEYNANVFTQSFRQYYEEFGVKVITNGNNLEAYRQEQKALDAEIGEN